MSSVSAVAPRIPAFPPISRGPLETLQVNLGYRCNQACTHCHVDAGPNRTEEMPAAIIDLVLQFATRQRVPVLDITGGAPELNSHFRSLVARGQGLGLQVIDRCNLTIIEEPGHADLPTFLARHQVRVIASLPCYDADNVDTQRGLGVFAKSIRALRALNREGYGQPDSNLILDLVYNPVGPFLPPAQASLETTYKERLSTEHDVRFNRLLTLANMPIARFRHALAREGTYTKYMDLLVANHHAANLSQVMCRSLLSIDWQGYVYDCDFNQMLGLPLSNGHQRTHLSELLTRDTAGLPIVVGNHCYGCTAGQGSSCGGALGA
ncbi:MAG: arsenosugar biosynthesis radical SAM protein ArsS [Gammaproteobacteria bacterium]|nr:arsenosugar biosynthesis radical SAM protein ArsS [Gammaproteobacteria bacterium]